MIKSHMNTYMKQNTFSLEKFFLHVVLLIFLHFAEIYKILKKYCA